MDEVAAADDVTRDVDNMVNGVADWPDGLGEVAMMSAVVSGSARLDEPTVLITCGCKRINWLVAYG